MATRPVGGESETGPTWDETPAKRQLSRLASVDRVSLAAVLAVALLTCMLGFAIPRALVSSDTQRLISGAHHAIGCIGRGDFVGCDVPHHDRADGPVGPWPLLQYLPAALLIEMGVPDQAIACLLGVMSLLAMGGLLLLLALGFRRMWSGWRALLPVVAISGPLLF